MTKIEIDNVHKEISKLCSLLAENDVSNLHLSWRKSDDNRELFSRCPKEDLTDLLSIMVVMPPSVKSGSETAKVINAHRDALLNLAIYVLNALPIEATNEWLKVLNKNRLESSLMNN